MPRPKKWRIVEYVPGQLHYVPAGKPKCELEEEILKVEEIEALRLKDIMKLSQDDCAQRMQVSRQTFQRILGDARSKVASALIEGKALRVAGGDFTRNVCQILCPKCNHQWEASYEEYHQIRQADPKCPQCGSEEICCNNKGSHCPNCCHEK